MKKLFPTLLILILVYTFIPSKVNATSVLLTSSGQITTSGVTYEIADKAGLIALREKANLRSNENGYVNLTGFDFVQTANISLEGENWIPIGAHKPNALETSNRDHAFLGNYDGNNYNITNLSIISNLAGYNIGLFGRNSGNISNLNLYIDEISFDLTCSACAGVVGRNSGSINNVEVFYTTDSEFKVGLLSTSSNSSSIGLFVGNSTGSSAIISNSKLKVMNNSSIQINNATTTGMFVGSNYTNSTIRDIEQIIQDTASITITKQGTGVIQTVGLSVGHNSSATIYNFSSVIRDHSAVTIGSGLNEIMFIGLFVGENEGNNGLISNSFILNSSVNGINLGSSITANTYDYSIGSFAGSIANDSTIQYSYVISNVNFTQDVGGFVGLIQETSAPYPNILNSFAAGTLNNLNSSTRPTANGFVNRYSESRTEWTELVIQNSFTSVIVSGILPINDDSLCYFDGDNPRTTGERCIPHVYGNNSNSFYVSELQSQGYGNPNAVQSEVNDTSGINISSGTWQSSVLNSGMNAFQITEGFYPLLYASGTTTLLPNQTLLPIKLDPFNYNVSFLSNGGSSVPSTNVSVGTALGNAPTPTRTGYQFAGWYSDPGLTSLFNLNTVLTGDITLYAKWNLTTFTITFNSLGGSVVGPVSGNEGDVVSLPIPTLKDYRFDGWLNSQGQLVSDPYTIKNVNETFTAKWTFVTFSPIRVIPLERTYYLEVEEAIELELGQEIVLPEFKAYELFGRVTTDLSDYVTISGELGEVPGEYPITYTLTYNDIVLTETMIVTLVDNIPPVVTIDMPSNIFYKDEFTPTITATDNVPGEVLITRVKDIDVNRLGVQLYIVDAEDASGNVTRLMKEVNVVMPEVRYEAVMVNAQRLMFVIYENLMDFTSMVLYMAQSVLEPPVSSELWEEYEERGFVATGPGQRIYLQLRDALGNIMSRESIELFWREPVSFSPTRTRGEVIYPEVEPSYYIPWPLVSGISVGGISFSGLLLWFIKRRKKNND